MKCTLLLMFLVPSTLFAQKNANPINSNSAELMKVFNAEFIEIINLKRAETDLPPLVVSDSLTAKAMELVQIVTGIAEGEMPKYSVDHYFAGQIRQGEDITTKDVIKSHWVTASGGHFPGIKKEYTQMGIGSILRKQDLLCYAIFK